MSENAVYVKIYDKADGALYPVNLKEVYRYAGYFGIAEPDIDEKIQGALNEVLEEAERTLTYKVCYRRMEISWKGEIPRLPFEKPSKGLAKCLKGSSEIVIFAATVGIGLDLLIKKYQHISPVKALLFQALGAERVEKLCDVFCEEVKETVKDEGLSCTSRFSPGYGDLSLETQKDVFSILDCSRKIGISLGASMLMTPSKSVTAIFGLKGRDDICTCSDSNSSVTEGCDNKNYDSKSHDSKSHDSKSYDAGKCEGCLKTDCVFRRGTDLR